MIAESLAYAYPMPRVSHIVKPMVTEAEQAASLGDRVKDALCGRNTEEVA